MSGMMALRIPRGLWTAAVMVTMVVLNAPMAEGRDAPQAFVEHHQSLCYFTNGTQRVRFVDRYIYNREEYARFDSDVGEYRPVTELGRPDAENWNSRKDILEQERAYVDTFCRHNYEVFDRFLVHRKAEPTVTVYPAKSQHLQHHNLLVCSVNGFYPGEIEVKWWRNGQEEDAGVISTGLIRNGDWTFQILVMLETVPQSGEVYVCQVQHPSQTSPITVEWRAQSESAQSKMLSGVGGFVLGLLFLGAGLFIHFKNQKDSLEIQKSTAHGHSGRQPTGLLS